MGTRRADSAAGRRAHRHLSQPLRTVADPMHRAVAIAGRAEQAWRSADESLVATYQSHGERFDAAAHARARRAADHAGHRRRFAHALADRWNEGTSAGAHLLAHLTGLDELAALVDDDAADQTAPEHADSEQQLRPLDPEPPPATRPALALVTAPNAPGAGRAAHPITGRAATAALATRS